MKLLLVSMPSVHFFRWTESIPNDLFDLYWFNITGSDSSKSNVNFKEVFSYSQKRKINNIKGEYTLSNKAPFFYQKIRPFLEVTENEFLDSIIKKIKPNIIHSFEMQVCSYPIQKTMNRNGEINWIYSCWGSDLFYYKQFAYHNRMIAKVLKRVNYLITDCKRDYKIAKELGYKGEHIGVIPGGGGYSINRLRKHVIPVENRKIILIKGYEHTFGRAINVIKALQAIISELEAYKVVVFGAHKSVVNYIKNNQLNFETYHRHQLNHEEVVKLMGQSLIYIGNSISDGLPNTLLEAIFMGAFPIQSNPGGVTEEVIIDNENGFLINNPEDINEIKNTILAALSDTKILNKAFNYNLEFAGENLDEKIVRQKIYNAYNFVVRKNKI